jgi:hypothetical protein
MKEVTGVRSASLRMLRGILVARRRTWKQGHNDTLLERLFSASHAAYGRGVANRFIKVDYITTKIVSFFMLRAVSVPVILVFPIKAFVPVN